MSKFLVDSNGQRIIKLRDDMPQGVAFNEAYAEYSIKFSDISDLVATLTEHGDIHIQNTEAETSIIPKETIYDSADTQLRTILNVQANLLDRQLSIIETMLKK